MSHTHNPPTSQPSPMPTQKTDRPNGLGVITPIHPPNTQTHNHAHRPSCLARNVGSIAGLKSRRSKSECDNTVQIALHVVGTSPTTAVASKQGRNTRDEIDIVSGTSPPHGSCMCVPICRDDGPIQGTPLPAHPTPSPRPPQQQNNQPTTTRIKTRPCKPQQLQKSPRPQHPRRPPRRGHPPKLPP